MLFRLILLLVLVPFVELALLVWLSQRMGWPLTIGLILLTGVVGAALARAQGLAAARAIRREVDAHRLPAEPILDSLFILVAGVLLVTPGVLTDAVGFALLVPPLRRRVRAAFIQWIQRRLGVRVVEGGQRGADGVIDGYVVRDAEARGPDEPKGPGP